MKQTFALSFWCVLSLSVYSSVGDAHSTTVEGNNAAGEVADSSDDYAGQFFVVTYTATARRRSWIAGGGRVPPLITYTNYSRSVQGAPSESIDRATSNALEACNEHLAALVDENDPILSITYESKHCAYSTYRREP